MPGATTNHWFPRISAVFFRRTPPKPPTILKMEEGGIVPEEQRTVLVHFNS
ncbi:MAG: hypothetical protein P8L40_07895 [Planktomarina sp.]|nr:hypothetical protein [Planktomarina sp.]